MAIEIEQNIEKLEERVASRRGVWLLLLALLRSRYFLASLIFYLTLLLAFGSYKITTYLATRGTFEGVEQLLVLPPPTPPPPRPPPEKVENKEVKVTATKTPVVRITVDAPSTFVRTETPPVAPVIKVAEIKLQTDMSRKIEQARTQRLVNVREFQKYWDVYGNKKAVRAKFTIFQAKYKGGDWNCNPSSLQNLMLQIRAWSRDRLDANLHPEVLDVGTDQLFVLRPPFVYLTGHKDFTLMESEVKNLRDYLTLGGAVWADSSLAGRRSRFDVAFRREMKRVMPDREFEVIQGTDHDLFDTFFQNIGLPSGMNFYQEPVELINIGPEMAVLYTLNGYGNLWESRLNSQNKIDWGLVNTGTMEAPRWQHVYGPHLSSPREETGIIYRNIDDETVNNSFRFGINVVVHLLTRYQKYFQFLPKDLPANNARLKQAAAAPAPGASAAPAAPASPAAPAPAAPAKPPTGARK